MTNITNQAKIYFNDYFYSIYIQIIKRQEYDYGSDMEDTKHCIKKKCKSNIKVFHLIENCKDT